MKIKMLTTWAHPHGIHPVGSLVEVAAEEAKRLIEHGHAVPAKSSAIETAAAKPKGDEETADAPAKRVK